MHSFVRILLVALLAVTAFAADVDGKWKATFETPNGQTIQSMFDFKAEGSNLNGTVTGRTGEAKIQDGKVDGDTITFTVTRSFNGQDLKIGYKGKLAGDEIKMTVSFGEDRTFDLVAKREK
jgi:hypothetical protein